MGSCFSRRKRSDATVTHNASPRSSFGLSCKSEALIVPSALRPNKSNNEVVLVVSKDASVQKSHASRKNKVAKTILAQRVENAPKSLDGGKGQTLQIAVHGEPNGKSEHSISGQKTEMEVCRSQNNELTLTCKPPVEVAHQQTTNREALVEHGTTSSALELTGGQRSFLGEGDDFPESCITPSLLPPEIEIEDKERPLPDNDDVLTEANNCGTSLPCSLARLKRSRSCEETIVSLPRSRACPGRSSFQEDGTSNAKISRLETIAEPLQFGATKFLEGLDLVDVLPPRLSFGENQSGLLGMEDELKPALLELSSHESRGLQADFFALKNRYLSSCGVSPQNAMVSHSCPDPDDGQLSVYSVSSENAEDDIRSSFGFVHSRASSLDSADNLDMLGMHSSSCRHPISVVEEVDENECGSDESETFEFKHSSSIHSGGLTQTKVLSRNRSTGEQQDARWEMDCGTNSLKETSLNSHGKGSSRVKELSIVATGDALLYTGSNSEEFDLIPSKSYVRGSPRRACIPSPASDAFFPQNMHNSFQEGLATDDQEMIQSCSLSVDDIILLLEKDELDEEILLSFLNLARGPPTSSHCVSMSSSHGSDAASEASFEFKIKSLGSTPHSTPSTPMLSAGSTPKRITQLSPLALTSEEIAEIWGVFEQRQALSLSNV